MFSIVNKERILKRMATGLVTFLLLMVVSMASAQTNSVKTEANEVTTAQVDSALIDSISFDEQAIAAADSLLLMEETSGLHQQLKKNSWKATPPSCRLWRWYWCLALPSA